MNPHSFVRAISAVQLDSVFNPYSDRCEVHDRADAPKRRRANLRAFLKSAIDGEVDSIWIARDLGYRGGRRTGLALTDEIHLQPFGKMYGLSLTRATKGPPMAERTAAIIWRMLTEIGQPVFLWNVFPLHPYELGDQFSNRCHTKYEREMFNEILFTLLQMLRPKRLVAIGRDAQHALRNLSLEYQPIRHPSYGGQSEFFRGMSNLYRLN